MNQKQMTRLKLPIVVQNIHDLPFHICFLSADTWKYSTEVYSVGYERSVQFARELNAVRFPHLTRPKCSAVLDIYCTY